MNFALELQKIPSNQYGPQILSSLWFRALPMLLGSLRCKPDYWSTIHHVDGAPKHYIEDHFGPFPSESTAVAKDKDHCIQVLTNALSFELNTCLIRLLTQSVNLEQETVHPTSVYSDLLLCSVWAKAPPNKYPLRVAEIKAPHGYALSEDAIKFEFYGISITDEQDTLVRATIKYRLGVDSSKVRRYFL